MKKKILKYKKLNIWFAAVLALSALFLLLRGNRNVMNFIAENVTQPYKTAASRFFGQVPFSVAEIIIVILSMIVLFCVIRLIAGLFRRERDLLYPRILTLVCIALTFYAASSWLWGANYYIDNFKDKSGMSGAQPTEEQLLAVTEYFAQKLNETADRVERDENGLFAADKAEIIEASDGIYNNVLEEYPFLAFDDSDVKPLILSYGLSMIDFTGFYFPLTGEANLNIHSPACMLPATVAHEMAHQRGIASEQECNFIAVVVSAESGIAAYEYSGWLLGYIHLNNALYAADHDAWQQVYDSLDERVKADISDNNTYWKGFEGLSTEAFDNIYDSFLKGYGESSGMLSYGEVVDLLVEYYAK